MSVDVKCKKKLVIRVACWLATDQCRTSQSKVPRLKGCPECLDIVDLLLLRLLAFLPDEPVLEPEELGDDAAAELYVEADLGVERHDERLALNLVLAVVGPEPDAEEVAVLRLGREREVLADEGGEALVLGLDAEGRLGEAVADHVGGQGQQLPDEVDVAVAADLPRHDAELVAGDGGDHGLDGLADARHLAVGLGGLAGGVGDVADAGHGGVMRERDYDHVAREVEALVGEGGGRGEGPLGDGDVGVVADAAAHVRGDVGVGQAEVAPVGPGSGGFPPVAPLAPLAVPAAVVPLVETAVALLATALLVLLKRRGCGPGGQGRVRPVEREGVHGLCLCVVAEGGHGDEAREPDLVPFPLHGVEEGLALVEEGAGGGREVVPGLQHHAELGDGVGASHRSLLRGLEDHVGPDVDAGRPHGGEEDVGRVGAALGLGVVGGVEGEVLLLGLPADDAGVELAAEADYADALGRLRRAALAEVVQVGADLLVGLDLGDDAGRQRLGADGEVGREGHLYLAAEEGVERGIVGVGREDVAGEDGEGEAVLGVEGRDLLQCRLKLAIERAKNDSGTKG